MTILDLLHQILGSSSKQKNEYLFHCPFCSGTKKKLSVNVLNNKWQCWVCGAKGGHILWLLKKLNLTPQQLTTAKELLTDVDIKQFKQTTSEAILQLPVEYLPLWTPQKTFIYYHALSYLKRRGISTHEILRYRIGYCETGTYANCVIIPSYDDHDQLNYFVARSIFDGSVRYKNPQVSKNVVMFENLLNYNEPLILVEGVFDAIALKQNAVPLLGKRLPKKLERKLLEHQVKNVIIFLDVDARNEALDLEKKLQQYNINTKLVLTNGKDASEMGCVVAWNAVQTAQSTTFKEFISQKLQVYEVL